VRDRRPRRELVAQRRQTLRLLPRGPVVDDVPATSQQAALRPLFSRLVAIWSYQLGRFIVTSTTAVESERHQSHSQQHRKHDADRHCDISGQRNLCSGRRGPPIAARTPTAINRANRMAIGAYAPRPAWFALESRLRLHNSAGTHFMTAPFLVPRNVPIPQIAGAQSSNIPSHPVLTSTGR